MRRRLIIGLTAGALVAAMLPGVASATPGNADVENFGMCVKEGIYQGASPKLDPIVGGDIVGPAVVNKNGDHHAKGSTFAPQALFGACPATP